MTALHREILEIEGLLAEAEIDSINITWERHHPAYPESLEKLMSTIARSGWVIGHYQQHELANVLARVEKAGLEEVRCAITRLNRSERWCTGAWIKVIRERSLRPLIARAKELTAPFAHSLKHAMTSTNHQKCHQQNTRRTDRYCRPH